MLGSAPLASVPLAFSPSASAPPPASPAAELNDILGSIRPRIDVQRSTEFRADVLTSLHPLG